MARSGRMSYELVLWISARDVDLLQHGPQSVAPRVVSQRDIVRAVAEILEEPVTNAKAEEEFFQRILQRSHLAGPTLFVFDNFETLENPADTFRWIDTHIRLPNKALITTRSRDFAGDFPLEIAGMTETEATELIDRQKCQTGNSTAYHEGL